MATVKEDELPDTLRSRTFDRIADEDGALPDKPLGTRPDWPSSKPPYKPDVPCYTQKAPNLKAKAGPSDALGASSGQSTARAAARGGDGG